MKQYVIIVITIMMGSDLYCAESGQERSKRKFENLYEIRTAPDGKQQRICTVGGCRRVFNSENAFRTHLVYGHCDIQEKSAPKEFRDRRAEYQRSAQRIVCSMCGENRAHGSMKEHMKRVHNIVRMYQCRVGECEEEFDRMAARDEHERGHALKITGLFEGEEAVKQETADRAGIYKKYDDTDKPLLTKKQAEILDDGIKAINQRDKLNGHVYNELEFEEALRQYLIMRYKKLGKNNPERLAQRLLEIYHDTPKVPGTSCRQTKAHMIIPEDLRISISQTHMKAINEIIGTYVTSNKDGASIDIWAHILIKKQLEQHFVRE